MSVKSVKTGLESYQLNDEKRSQIDSQIIDLKRRRNELSYISRLPLELLYTIFKFMGDSEKADAGTFPDLSSRSRRHGTKVAHVCHYWRTVSLQSPHLWSIIDLAHTAIWVQELLKRSRTTPISVYVPILDNLESQDAIPDVLSHLDRMEHLYLSLKYHPCGASAQKAFIKELYTRKFMRLKSIFIQGNCPVSIPQLFSEGAPSLVEVELLHCAIPWTSHLFSKQLTSLKIVSSGTRQHPGTMAQFLDALQSMSQLQSLTLETPLPKDSHNSSSHRIIQLSRLTHLKLKSSIQHSLVLLTHITIPLSAKVYIDWDSDNLEAKDISGFLSVMHSSCFLDPSGHLISRNALTGFPSIYELNMSPDDDKLKVVFRWNYIDSQSPDVPGAAFWSITSALHKHPSLFEGLVAPFCLQHLKSISIDLPISKSFMAQLGALQSLQTVFLSGNNVASFFDYIYGDVFLRAISPSGSPADRTVPQPIKSTPKSFNGNRPYFTHFPHMTIMGFCEIDMGLARFRKLPRRACPTITAIDIEKLCEFFQVRERFGAPIHSAHFRKCYNLTQEDAEALMGIVDVEICRNRDGRMAPL